MIKCYQEFRSQIGNSYGKVNFSIEQRLIKRFDEGMIPQCSQLLVYFLTDSDDRENVEPEYMNTCIESSKGRFNKV